jgi:probable HAF family extracellular repeat protein
MSKHRERHVCMCAFAGAFLALCLAGSPAARAGSYNFATVDYGNGYQTLLYGINDNGLLSGIAFNPTTGYNTGVFFNGGAGTLVVAPGAVDTEVYQSNNAGQVAVSYYGSDLIYHAAVYNTSTSSWTYLPDVPGYAENLAGGINNHGVVLGDPFLNSSYTGGVGWTWNGSSYSFFSAPGSDPAQLGTATYSINDAGQSVGYFQDSTGTVHGYLKTGSNFTTLDAPGAVGYTSAQGINNLGAVTGTYIDASNNYNGFLWNNGQFTTIDVPGAMGTDVTSINNQGDLAGWYLDANGVFHGFEASPVPEPGTATLMVAGVVGMVLLVRRLGRRADRIGAA